jgi:hypothetical protein
MVPAATEEGPLPHSHSAPRIRSSPRILVSSALVAALVALCLCLGAKPAAAAGFHSCASHKLENQGIFSLKASHAKCKLARQVAYARRRGDETPKGFSCVTGEGGNLTPFSCSRGNKVVKFFLEG